MSLEVAWSGGSCPDRGLGSQSAITLEQSLEGRITLQRSGREKKVVHHQTWPKHQQFTFAVGQTPI